MTVSCDYCGETWPRDPALEVACPQCAAAVGKQCRRPSGHDCELHVSRDRAAVDAGLLDVCTAAPTVKRPDLFGNVHETYQTEAELNGWRAKQGALL